MLGKVDIICLLCIHCTAPYEFVYCCVGHTTVSRAKIHIHYQTLREQESRHFTSNYHLFPTESNHLKDFWGGCFKVGFLIQKCFGFVFKNEIFNYFRQSLWGFFYRISTLCWTPVKFNCHYCIYFLLELRPTVNRI